MDEHGPGRIRARSSAISLVPVALVRRCTARPWRSSSGPPRWRSPRCTWSPLPRRSVRCRPWRSSPLTCAGCAPRPGHRSRAVPMARQRGIVAAYDDVLVDTAGRSRCPTTLAELPEGIDREAERLRLEHALERAGSQLAASTTTTEPPSLRGTCWSSPSRSRAGRWPRSPGSRSPGTTVPTIPRMRPTLTISRPPNRPCDSSISRSVLVPIDHATGPSTWHSTSPRIPRTRIVVARGWSGAPYGGRRWWRGAHLASVSSDPGSDGRRR